MKNMHRVVRCSAAGVGPPPDKPGISYAADVEAVFVKIVLAPALTGQLAEAVNRIWVHYAILRGVMLRRVRPKDGDRAWPKNLCNIKLNRKVEHLQQARHVQVPGSFWFLFANRR